MNFFLVHFENGISHSNCVTPIIRPQRALRVRAVPFVIFCFCGIKHLMKKDSFLLRTLYICQVMHSTRWPDWASFRRLFSPTSFFYCSTYYSKKLGYFFQHKFVNFDKNGLSYISLVSYQGPIVRSGLFVIRSSGNEVRLWVRISTRRRWILALLILFREILQGAILHAKLLKVAIYLKMLQYFNVHCTYIYFI
jgi:hypothetical protein